MKNIFYAILYHPLINFFVRNINRPLFKSIVKIPPSGRVKFNFGELSFYIHTNQTNYITHVLYYDGCENYEYAAIFKKLVAKCETFFDIGTNTGFYTIVACKSNPKIKVTCFEPAIGSLYYLSKSIISNDISGQVKTEPIALSDHSGTIEFHDVTNNKYKNLKYNLAGESSTSAIQTGRPFKSYTVNCTTLNDYVAKNKAGKIDLMKIDTEGTEDSILKNAGTVLSNDKPIIICETLFNRIESQLDDLMRQHGYLFFNHYPEGLKEVSTIKREKDDGVRNCFFVHPDRKHLIEEFIFTKG